MGARAGIGEQKIRLGASEFAKLGIGAERVPFHSLPL